MTLSALIAVLGGLLPLVLAVMEAIQGHQARERTLSDALTKRSLSELHAGTDRVRRNASVQSGGH